VIKREENRREYSYSNVVFRIALVCNLSILVRWKLVILEMSVMHYLIWESWFFLESLHQFPLKSLAFCCELMGKALMYECEDSYLWKILCYCIFHEEIYALVLFLLNYCLHPSSLIFPLTVASNNLFLLALTHATLSILSFSLSILRGLLLLPAPLIVVDSKIVNIKSIHVCGVPMTLSSCYSSPISSHQAY